MVNPRMYLELPDLASESHQRNYSVEYLNYHRYLDIGIKQRLILLVVPRRKTVIVDRKVGTHFERGFQANAVPRTKLRPARQTQMNEHNMDTKSIPAVLTSTELSRNGWCLRETIGQVLSAVVSS